MTLIVENESGEGMTLDLTSNVCGEGDGFGAWSTATGVPGRSPGDADGPGYRDGSGTGKGPWLEGTGCGEHGANESAQPRLERLDGSGFGFGDEAIR